MTAFERVRSVFRLAQEETAQLFGAPLREVVHWDREGVPLERVPQVERFHDVAEEFSRELNDEAIPVLVRGRLQALEDRTVLESLAQGDVSQVRDFLQHLVGPPYTGVRS